MSKHRLDCLCLQDYLEHPQIRRWAQDGHWPYSAAFDAGPTDDAVQKELDRLYDKHQNLVNRIQRLEMQLTKRQVLRAPIRGVPNEILGEIFCYLPHNFTDSKDMMSARLVCMQWNTVAIHTPKIWTCISTISIMTDDFLQPDAIPHPTPKIWTRDWASQWVSRSKKLPLEITLAIHPKWDLDEVFYRSQPILRAISRWTSCDIRCPSLYIPRIFNIFVNSCPVRSLTLEHDDDDRGDGLFYRDRSVRLLFPNLNRLQLDMHRLQYTPRIDAPRLTSLDIMCLEISFQDYSALSLDTPAVSKMKLASVAFYDDNGKSLEATTFHHTRLESLTLDGEFELEDSDAIACLAGLLYKIITASDRFREFEIAPTWPWIWDIEPLSDLMKAVPCKPPVKHFTLSIDHPSSWPNTPPSQYTTSIVTWFSIFSHADTVTVAHPGAIRLQPSWELFSQESEWLRGASRTIFQALLYCGGFTKAFKFEDVWLDGKALCGFISTLWGRPGGDDLSFGFNKEVRLWHRGRFVRLPQHLQGNVVGARVVREEITREMAELWPAHISS
jgi:hypothetical protein